MLIRHRYLIADYERRNFSMSQCSWEAGAQQHIIAITSPLDSAPAHHLTKGQIAGTTIGSIAGLVILVLLLFRINFRRRALPSVVDTGKPELEASDRVAQEKVDLKPQEIDGQEHLGNEIDGTGLPGHEIDGHLYHGHELEGTGQSYELPALESPATEMAH